MHNVRAFIPLGYITTGKINSSEECELGSFCSKIRQNFVCVVCYSVVVFVIFHAEEHTGDSTIQKRCLVTPL